MSGITLYTTAEVAEILRMNPQVVQRKIQHGDIPAYRIGREWRVERAQLLSWLDRHSNQRNRSADDRTLETFFDENGRLRALPAQRKKRDVVLRKLVERFAPDRTYSERQVSTILRGFHDDVASIRREMVANKLLVRTREGVYKRVTSGASAALRRA